MKIDSERVMESIEKRLDWSKDMNNLFADGYRAALFQMKDMVGLFIKLAEGEEEIEKIKASSKYGKNMSLEQAIEHLKNEVLDEEKEWSCAECKQEHQKLLMFLLELQAYRKLDEENETEKEN